MSNDVKRPREAAEAIRQPEIDIAARLANHDLLYADPLDGPGAPYDPYNTGSFKVLAQRPPRRTLDDLRKLDAEIRGRRKPWD